LKKGQGLARFNMKPKALKKPKGVDQRKSASIPSSQEVSQTRKAEVNNIPSKQEAKGSSRQLAVPQNKVNYFETEFFRCIKFCSHFCYSFRWLFTCVFCNTGAKKDCWQNSAVHIYK
jgi:hypothetical protein